MASVIQADTVILSSGAERNAADIGYGSGAAWGGITGTLSAQTDLATALGNKSDGNHDHAGVYSPTGHNHDASYSASGHNHDASYSPTGHNHDASYYTEGEVNTFLGGKSDTGHNHSGVYAPASHDHDASYYTEGEVNTLLAGKSDTGHSHAGTEQTANKGAASGYAPLDAGTRVPTANLGSGSATSSTYLRGDQTWATPAGGSDPWTFVKLSGDFTTSLATNETVTGLNFTPAANKTYLVQGIFLLRTATATVGARPGIAWPTGLTDGTARVEASNALTTSAIRSWGARTTQNAASTGLATTTDSHHANLEALLIVGASPSGNFQITLASETAATNVTMKAGSFIAYREI